MTKSASVITHNDKSSPLYRGDYPSCPYICPMNIIERILRKLPECNDEDCWVSEYSTASQGYCNVGGENNSGSFRLHRVVWEAHNAMPLPKGAVLLHTCDNPACCNPHHMTVGTQADNLADMASKGRGRKPLIPVLEAQRLFSLGFTHSQIAEQLGFQRASICRALKHYTI